MNNNKRVQRFDSLPLDATYFTAEGYLVDHPIVTSVGIFVYHNPDGSERRELRLPEEVFAEKSLASYKGKPIIITHDAGYVDTENVQEEEIGTILSNGYRDGNDVRAEIVIHDVDSVKRSGMRELSCGYNLRLDETPGVWEGQPYDAVQRDIEINHLALVNKARAGEQARLNMDGQGRDYLKGVKLNMDKKKRTDGAPTPEELAAAVEAFKKRRAERSGAAADGGTGAEPPVQGATDNNPASQDKPDSVQLVKDRRDRRDADGDPADMPGAMGVIAQQDEDIDTLLGVIDVLRAEASAPGAAKDGAGCEGNLDDGDEESGKDTQPADGEKKTNTDSANDFGELLRVVRVGDRLNMDGLETMSVKDAKKAVLGKLKPTLHLDGKSAAYINAAFDMAVSDRKDTNYQRRQMMHGDGVAPAKQTSSASEARQRMIDRRMNKEGK